MWICSIILTDVCVVFCLRCCCLLGYSIAYSLLSLLQKLSIRCSLCLVKRRVSHTSAGKKCMPYQRWRGLSWLSNYCEMDKWGAKKRTRVILLFRVGSEGRKQFATFNHQSQNSTVCVRVRASLCVCEEGRERESWHIMRCKKKPTLHCTENKIIIRAVTRGRKIQLQ